MFTNFWLINIYLIVYLIATLAFATYTWLYIDLSRSKEGERSHMFNVFGGLLLTVSFGWQLFANIEQDGTLLPAGIPLSLLSGGLLLVTIATFTEPIPRKPKASAEEINFRNQKTVLGFAPALLFGGVITNVILSLVLLARTLEKQFLGKTKQVAWLAGFWSLFSVHTFLAGLSVFGDAKYTAIDELTRPYTLIWLLTNLVLLAAVLALFRWMYLFLTFRPISRLFLSIWQIGIAISVVVATFFSIIAISTAEKNVQNILERNTNLISFNIEQTTQSMEDVGMLLSENARLVNAIEAKDETKIEQILSEFSAGNIYVDAFFTTDMESRQLSGPGYTAGIDSYVGDNIHVRRVLDGSTQSEGFLLNSLGINEDRLVYQFTYQVKNDTETVGSLSILKYFDRAFLTYLQSQTEQELVVLQESEIAATTVETISDASALTQREQSEDQDEVQIEKIRINGIPYYASFIQIKNNANTTIAEIVSVSEQVLLVESSQAALRDTFLVAIILCVLATVPSYYLAKNLDKSLRA